jgi:hypothetical protein
MTVGIDVDDPKGAMECCNSVWPEAAGPTVCMLAVSEQCEDHQAAHHNKDARPCVMGFWLTSTKGLSPHDCQSSWRTPLFAPQARCPGTCQQDLHHMPVSGHV